jgi:hypothetical protein
MIAYHRNRVCAALLLFGGQLCWLAATAQTATNGPVPHETNAAPARRPSSPPPLPMAVFPPPTHTSPVTFFRELLAMSGAERKQALTNRSPESQERILAKVREYQALKPNERELRLQVTELQWYLLPLMSTPTNRELRLASIPPPQRTLVEERLRAWDQLPPAEQKRLLENQATVRYLSEIEGLTTAQRREVLKSIPPGTQSMLEKGIVRWDEMSLKQRQTTLARFNQFFELTPAEKDKALKTLSPTERSQIEKTLQAYGTLSPAQRATAIRSFEKFARLSVEERQQFLKNAERWEALPPAERQAWRDLVRHLPPPLPPVPPPVPHVVPYHRASPAVVTNGN